MDDLKARLSGEKPFNGAELRDSLDRIEKLEAENAELNAECEKAWDAYRYAFDQAVSNGEALKEVRATITSSAR